MWELVIEVGSELMRALKLEAAVELVLDYYGDGSSILSAN